MRREKIFIVCDVAVGTLRDKHADEAATVGSDKMCHLHGKLESYTFSSNPIPLLIRSCQYDWKLNPITYDPCALGETLDETSERPLTFN